MRRWKGEEIPGENTSNEWLELVSDEEYGKLNNNKISPFCSPIEYGY